VSPFSRSVVALRPVSDADVKEAVQNCLDACEWASVIPRGSRVVVKPNLCTTVPEKLAMSNTDPRITEAVCEILVSRARQVFVVESDNLRQKADDAFEVSGYPAFAERMGLKLVNLSSESRVRIEADPIPLDLPRILLEADAFVTLPVLKTHALTYFTGALKNQWGCVPQRDRILLHRYIDPLLVSLQRILKPALSVMDAIIAMEGRGPVSGIPRRMNLLLASRDAVALDVSAMRLTGLDPACARHVVSAAAAGLGRMREEEIDLDGPWNENVTQFAPAIFDIALRAMNRMSRYPWFVRNALERDYMFYPARAVVQTLRRARIIGGANR